MSVKVKLDKTLFGDSGEKDILIEATGNNIGECLDYIVKQRPSLKDVLFAQNSSLRYDNLFIVNGESVLSNIAEIAIKDGDEIEITKFTGS